ncbi:MAG: hypothetical protein A3H27_18675 [Acidobacteria bacterium RIFCSPLOWO2_02_FULL_59_13]|nr:MAG: hypothetical protein A3H27_18675 [Acidobacteria bacterium RIFCSPLOWO2_02_FULL_59_13]
MHRGRWKFTAGLGFAVCLLGSVLQAQTGTATISGVVEDESGAVVPGATVVVTHVDTGISRSLETNSAGRYSAPGLIPGNYEIQAQSSGFQTAIRQGIQLRVGSELSIGLLLRVGQVEQTTVVTADAPLVDTVTSSLSAVVEEKTILDLPLNGRSFDQLISLQSSAPQVRAKSISGIHGNAAFFSVAGARGVSNRYTMDGIEMVGGGATHSMPGGALGTNMGVEAVQEFQVMTSNYSAVYGKKAGGVVNVATRSGTNAIHGSAYEFLRNDNLDARNFFDQGAQPPEFKRNQFGGAIGGPIRRDSTFFFGNYEGFRENLGEREIAIVMDDNTRRGLLPKRDAQGNMIPGEFEDVGVAPNVQPFLALWPRVNGRLFGDGTGEFHNAATQVSRQDFFLIRVDRKLSDQDFLFGRYNFSDSELANPGQTFDVDVDASREQMAALEWKRAWTAVVNSLRFGFSRGASLLDSQLTVEVDPSMLFLPGAATVGPLTLAGFTGFEATTLASAGTGPSAERMFVMNLFQVADQVYHQRGAHL